MIYLKKDLMLDNTKL